MKVSSDVQWFLGFLRWTAVEKKQAADIYLLTNGNVSSCKTLWGNVIQSLGHVVFFAAFTILETWCEQVDVHQLVEKYFLKNFSLKRSCGRNTFWPVRAILNWWAGGYIPDNAVADLAFPATNLDQADSLGWITFRGKQSKITYLTFWRWDGHLEVSCELSKCGS